MVAVEASKISLSPPSSSSSSSSSSAAVAPASLLFEPSSLSLALIHSDTSVALYPSLASPLSISSLPAPQTLIPPPSSSFLFLLLRKSPDSDPHVLFIVSGPHRGGSRILLRFYALRRNGAGFTRPTLVCKQKGFTFEPDSGVSIDHHHGFSIKLSGSVNFFSMYSASSSKVWVFAVKAAADDNSGDDGLVLKLMNCAVIECCRPVWSICVAFGLMVFGEENGVRVFNLRSVAKGHDKKAKTTTANSKSSVRGSRLPNGVIGGRAPRHSENPSNGDLEGKVDKHCGSIKQKFLKLKQDDRAGHAIYVTFERDLNVDSKSSSVPVVTLKATSIQALSPQTFMVLDSSGDLHFLRLPKSKPSSALDSGFHLKRLPHIMKVQHLATLLDSSMRAEKVLVSDGDYSVCILARCDRDATDGENIGNDVDEKQWDISVEQSIFTSEKIQAIIPISSKGTLILGQGSIYAYMIS